MKGKEIMIVSGIIIVLLLVIIIGATINKNNDNPVNPQVGEIGQNVSSDGEFTEVMLDGTKVNTSDALSKTKEVDGLEISNIRLVEKDNVSQLLADVKNPTSSTKGDFPVNIIVLDKSGNEIVNIGGYIDKVNAGETVQLNASATVDFANAYDFKVEKN